MRQEHYIGKLKGLKGMYDLLDKLDESPIPNRELIHTMYVLGRYVEELASHVSGKAIANDATLVELLNQKNKWNEIDFKSMRGEEMTDKVTLKDLREKDKFELFPNPYPNLDDLTFKPKDKASEILEEIENMFGKP
jgi:hypothetical protein